MWPNLDHSWFMVFSISNRKWVTYKCFWYQFTPWQTICKTLLKNLIDLIGHHLSCMVDLWIGNEFKGKLHEPWYSSFDPNEALRIWNTKWLFYDYCTIIIKQWPLNICVTFSIRSRSSIFSSTTFATSTWPCLCNEILYSLCTEEEGYKHPWWQHTQVHYFACAVAAIHQHCLRRLLPSCITVLTCILHWMIVFPKNFFILMTLLAAPQ